MIFDRVGLNCNRFLAGASEAMRCKLPAGVDPLGLLSGFAMLDSSGTSPAPEEARNKIAYAISMQAPQAATLIENRRVIFRRLRQFWAEQH